MSAARCWRVSLRLLMVAAFLTCSLQLQAEDNTTLYEAQAIVTGQREPERTRALPDTFTDVLIKGSGDPSIADDRRIVALKGKAADFVESFRYHDRMAGIPVHDEQGTRDRPYDLIVHFDASKIDAALRSLGREPWPDPRPHIAVFIGMMNGPVPYLLTTDDNRHIGERLSLDAAAQKYGMRIVLPKASALASAGIDFDQLSAIGSERLLALSKDAGGDAALVGVLYWIEQEFGWRADWRVVQQRDSRWRVRGVIFDQAFRNGLAGSARILSGHGDPD